MDRVISLRVSEDDYQALVHLAEVVGVPVSEMIRRAALSLTYPPPATPTTGTMSAPLVRMLVSRPDSPPSVLDTSAGQDA